MADYGKVDWNAFKKFIGDDDWYQQIVNNDADRNLSDGYDPIDTSIMTKEDFDDLVDSFTSTHEEHLNGSQDYVILPNG